MLTPSLFRYAADYSTIHKVIAELEQILATCARTNNRLGYFAALYYKVTCRVREGIKNEEFEDGPRMERLDVAFANRYLQAWHTWQAGQLPTASWQVAFKAGTSRQALVLQHLLLGMNAHINLDLGIAAAEVAAVSGLPATRKDFLAINGILALLTGDAMASLRQVSPLLSLLGLHATRYHSILIQLSLSNARDGAWCFSEELVGKTEPIYTPILQARDKNIAELATSLTRATGLMRLTLWAIHLVEWRRPARIIQALRDGGPRSVKAASVQ